MSIQRKALTSRCDLKSYPLKQQISLSGALLTETANIVIFLRLFYIGFVEHFYYFSAYPVGQLNVLALAYRKHDIRGENSVFGAIYANALHYARLPAYTGGINKIILYAVYFNSALNCVARGARLR